ncbi:MAG: type VII secretion protein EccB [Gordonia sp. (in: high G+C Gram-positive bacteria)]
MARQLTTKAQVNGYRFLLRRLEHALVRRDVRMLHDPMRAQLRALLIGTVLAVLVLAGCGVWGLVSPQGSVGKASIVATRSGGMYVLINGTAHPVLNLSSARLILGSSTQPATVSDRKLAGYPRGPLLGIAGAPFALPGSAHPDTSVWTVCDGPLRQATLAGDAASMPLALSVIAAAPVMSEKITVAGPDAGIVVTDGTDTFLIYRSVRGRISVPVRARVDTGSVPVMRALGLEGVAARPVTTGLLNAFPEVEPLVVPAIAGAGAAGPLSDPGVRVGSVIKSTGIDDAPHYFVVLHDGVQPVTQATAEIVRLADRAGAASIATVAPGVIAAVPMLHRLPVDDFPVHTPRLIDTDVAPTVCRVWRRDNGSPQAHTELLVGRALPLPAGASAVAVATADSGGPGVDFVYLTPGTGEYIQVTGDEPDSLRTESRFYVSDIGVRFGVPDARTGQLLGLGGNPARAPWSVISLLVAGATLSRQNALVAHDGIAPDVAGRVIVPPGN